jgi:hypothetical protein
MASEAVLNIERLIFEAWELGMTNGEVITYVISKMPVSRDIVETVLEDLINRMTE